MNLSPDDIKKIEYRENLVRNHAGKAGLRGKINAMCIGCIYDPYAEGTWRKQVENCTSRNCPLYEVRPTTTTDQAEQQEVFNNQEDLAT